MTNKLIKAIKIFTLKTSDIDITWVRTILNHKFDKTHFLKLSQLIIFYKAWLANQYYIPYYFVILPDKLTINAGVK